MPSKGKIFVSYASDQKDQAEPIALALRSRGYEVFFDKDDLPAGQTYHDQIAESIGQSDILVFLISPESVNKGRYTVTELGIARRKWKTPKGRVLPIMIAETPIADIPPFIKEVSFFAPSGNLVAETGLEVDRMMADIRDAENKQLIAKAKRIAVTALILALAALGLIAVFHEQIPFLTSDTDTPVAESTPSIAKPAGSEIIRSPNLGLQIYQNGEKIPLYINDSQDYDIVTLTAQLKRAPFEIRLKEAAWAESQLPEQSLQIAALDDDSIFSLVNINTDSRQTPLFAPGTGTADNEHGSGTLWSTHLEYGDCCHSHNYIYGNRFNVSEDGYKGVFISNIINRLTEENMIDVEDQVHLVLYLNKIGGPEWDNPDPLLYGEVEGITMEFID